MCRMVLLYFFQVLVSELGDETFIIAAILAMRHPRSLVFAGGIAALATMTVRQGKRRRAHQPVPLACSDSRQSELRTRTAYGEAETHQPNKRSYNGLWLLALLHGGLLPIPLLLTCRRCRNDQVLSTLLGMIAPALISKDLVNKAACFLYICFGALWLSPLIFPPLTETVIPERTHALTVRVAAFCPCRVPPHVHCSDVERERRRGARGEKGAEHGPVSWPLSLAETDDACQPTCRLTPHSHGRRPCRVSSTTGPSRKGA